MPRVDVRTPGYGVLLGSGPNYRAAPSGNTVRLAHLLGQAVSARYQRVNVNIATGFTGVQSGYALTPQSVVARLRRGHHWVDYGNWPFGSYGNVSGFLGIGAGTNPRDAGFGAFVAAAGLTRAIPATSAADHEGEATLTACMNSIGGLFNGYDPYAFALCDWTWGGEAQGNGYPYAFGFPTLLQRNTAVFRAMPGTPVGSGLGPHGVSVYSAFAVRVGPGWYFEAQPTIGIVPYAQFIAGTIGATIPSAALLQAGTPSTPSCAAAVKPSLQVGDTGPWVALAQQRLNAWGASLAVDGIFGPLTEAAVRALQQAHVGQRVGHQPAITVSGDIGPGLWALLCSTPRGGQGSSGGRGHAHHQPASHPAAPGLVQWLMTHLNLTQAEAELVLVGGGVTALVLLSGK